MNQKGFDTDGAGNTGGADRRTVAKPRLVPCLTYVPYRTRTLREKESERERARALPAVMYGHCG
jgi:hypothetical protein